MKKSHSKNLNKKFGKWKKTEHDRFIKALEKYGKNWVEVQKVVKTRSLAQVRSHAQKILTNLSKEQRRVIQMNDFERMADFCKVKQSSSSSVSLHQQEKEPEVKKEENCQFQVKKELNQSPIQCDMHLPTNFNMAISNGTGNFLQQKFYFKSYPVFNYQTLGNPMFQYQGAYTQMNPFFGWQFPIIDNPLKEEQGKDIHQEPSIIYQHQ